MELILKSRNGKVSDRQRSHIEEKLGRLDRYFEGAAQSITVEISSEKRRNQNEIKRMQVTLVGDHGVILRADQSFDDLYKAVDQVHDVLQRQIMRYKGKHWRRGRLRRKSGEFIASEVEQAPALVADDEQEDEEERHVVRVKEFALKPMFTDEAIEQMELLDHSFFVFRDADTSQINVVYRRKDGNYGLIAPEEA